MDTAQLLYLEPQFRSIEEQERLIHTPRHSPNDIYMPDEQQKDDSPQGSLSERSVTDLSPEVSVATSGVEQETDMTETQTDDQPTDPEAKESEVVEPKQSVLEILPTPSSRLSNPSTPQLVRSSSRRQLPIVTEQQSQSGNSILGFIENLASMSGNASLGMESMEQDFRTLKAPKDTISPASEVKVAFNIEEGASPIDIKQDSPETLAQRSMSWFSGTPTSPSPIVSATAIPKETTALFFSVPDEGEDIPMASLKRDVESHELFPELEKTERLVEDYTCAWLKDILIQVRPSNSGTAIYLREPSRVPLQNILDVQDCHLVRLHKISREEISRWSFPERKRGLTKAIEIVTSDGKYFFGSFYARETAYNMITRIIAYHPNNTVVLKELPHIDATVPRESASSPSLASLTRNSLSRHSGTLHRSRSLGNNELLLTSRTVSMMKEPQDLGLAENLGETSQNKHIEPHSPMRSEHIVHQKIVAHLPKGDPVLARPLIQQKPRSHTDPHPLLPASLLQAQTKSPVEVYTGDDPLPAPKKSVHLLDQEFEMALPQLFNHVFGTESAHSLFSRQFWANDMKFKEIHFTNWVDTFDSIHGDLSKLQRHPHSHDFSDIGELMVRRLQYTVPVFNPLGPPSTICHIKQKILKKGAGFVVVNAIHETPGVPGGGCFHISLQITMTQVSETKSRMYSSYELVFTKSTFYKTPIELATPSAMKDYYKLLANALLELKTPNTDQPVETETIAKEDDVASLHIAAAEEPHVYNTAKAATPRMSLIPANINSPSTIKWGFLFTSFINLLLIYNIVMLNYKVDTLNTAIGNSHKQTAQAMTDAIGNMKRQTEKALVDAVGKIQKQTDMAVSDTLVAAKHTDKVLTNVVDNLPKEERTEL